MDKKPCCGRSACKRNIANSQANSEEEQPEPDRQPSASSAGTANSLPQKRVSISPIHSPPHSQNSIQQKPAGNEQPEQKSVKSPIPSPPHSQNSIQLKTAGNEQPEQESVKLPSPIVSRTDTAVVEPTPIPPDDFYVQQETSCYDTNCPFGVQPTPSDLNKDDSAFKPSTCCANQCEFALTPTRIPPDDFYLQQAPSCNDTNCRFGDQPTPSDLNKDDFAFKPCTCANQCVFASTPLPPPPPPPSNDECPSQDLAFQSKIVTKCQQTEWNIGLDTSVIPAQKLQMLCPASAKASAQVLYVEPNFNDAPSEMDVYYECFSDMDIAPDCHMSSESSRKFKGSAPLSASTNNFCDELRQLASATQKLVKCYEEGCRMKAERARQLERDRQREMEMERQRKKERKSQKKRTSNQIITITVPLSIRLEAPTTIQ